jgi:hypothetical protein
MGEREELYERASHGLKGYACADDCGLFGPWAMNCTRRRLQYCGVAKRILQYLLTSNAVDFVCRGMLVKYHCSG